MRVTQHLLKPSVPLLTLSLEHHGSPSMGVFQSPVHRWVSGGGAVQGNKGTSPHCHTARHRQSWNRHLLLPALSLEGKRLPRLPSRPVYPHLWFLTPTQTEKQI